MKLSGYVRHLFTFGKEVVQDYTKDNGSLVAAAVSFYVFLSFLPLILLAVSLASYILGAGRSQDLILGLIRDNAPSFVGQGGIDVRKIVEQVVKGRGAATGFGVLTLIWTGTSVIATFENAINLIWNVREPRGFLKQRLLAIGLLLLMGALLGASVGITALVTAIRALDLKVFELAPSQWGWLWQTIGLLIPLMITVTTFTLFFKIVPNTRVPWKPALLGGVFAGILWEIAKYGFSYYASNIANYSAVYGPLAGVILLLVWIYYSAIVTVLGAEVASVHAGRRAPGAQA